MTVVANPKRLFDSEQSLRSLMQRVQGEGRTDRSAHDLSNALSVIVMYRELVKDPMCDEVELRGDIEKALVYADEVLVRIGVRH